MSSSESLSLKDLFARTENFLSADALDLYRLYLAEVVAAADKQQENFPDEEQIDVKSEAIQLDILDDVFKNIDRFGETLTIQELILSTLVEVKLILDEIDDAEEELMSLVIEGEEEDTSPQLARDLRAIRKIWEMHKNRLISLATELEGFSEDAVSETQQQTVDDLIKELDRLYEDETEPLVVGAFSSTTD